MLSSNQIHWCRPQPLNDLVSTAYVEWIPCGVTEVAVAVARVAAGWVTGSVIVFAQAVIGASAPPRAASEPARAARGSRTRAGWRDPG